MRDILKRYYNIIKDLEGEVLEGLDIKEEYEEKIYDIVEDIAQSIILEMYVRIEKIYEPRNYEYKKQLLRYKILWYVLDEYGLNISDELFSNLSIGKWRNDAKTRLLMMFIKTFGEIIYLIEGGYSFCALSRIRYIYEVGVFLEIIDMGTEEVAKKFILFSQKGSYDIVKHIDENAKRDINKRLDDLGYGDDPKSDYGWAKNIINKKYIKFKNLADITTLKDLYFIYAIACDSVHADVYGSILAIDLTDEEKIKKTWVTTPSKNGTEEILIYLNQILLKVILAYFSLEGNFVSIIVAVILKNLITNK